MKKLILIVFLAIAPLTKADISLGKQASAPAAAEYTSLAKDVIGVITELTTVLETVKDKASADAVAPQLSGITARMLELQRKAEALPRPGQEVEQLVHSSINMAEARQLVSRFMNSFINIAMNNAYGSQALLDAMGPLMNSIPSIQE
jgi:hypothetical protein